MKKCRNCGREYFPSEDDRFDSPKLRAAHRDGYCSVSCNGIADKAYDNYVDPLGAYSNKDRISTHD